MAWIETIDEDAATGDLRQSYAFYMKSAKADRVANILKVHGLSPDSFRHHLDYYRHLAFGEGPLRRYQREMIATYVSKLNGCEY